MRVPTEQRPATSHFSSNSAILKHALGIDVDPPSRSNRQSIEQALHVGGIRPDDDLPLILAANPAGKRGRRTEQIGDGAAPLDVATEVPRHVFRFERAFFFDMMPIEIANKPGEWRKSVHSAEV